MKYKKSLVTVILAGMTVFSVTGCDNTEEPTPAIEQPSSAMEPSTTEEGGESSPAEDGELPETGIDIPPPTDNTTMPGPPRGGLPGERPGAPEIDLASAAEKLGVTEEQLSEALGDMQQGFPDLATSAAELGVSEESLREVLGLPESGFPEGGPQPGGPPDGVPPAEGQFPGEPPQDE